MCGIYGSTLIYNKEQIRSKLKRTGFRGPDRMKFTTKKTRNGQLILGHNRLSIIDLDKRSDQPFAYKHLNIVFNGEIYNFLVLRKRLEQKGYRFNTSSDTEVICAAYLEYGKNCVAHFNGMFAFVIYDTKKQVLFGATDRLAQKPLYIYHKGTDFEFASQLSSIQLFNNKLSISSKAIQNYFSWNYIPAPLSIFNEITKIEGGQRFWYDLVEGTFEKESYWDIAYLDKQNSEIKYNEAKEELELLLADATKIRLFADVPVGVFLSGGIDSSLITALATKSTSKQIKTFSIKFDHKEFDESPYAKSVAHHLATDHTTISCGVNEGLSLIDNFSHYYDEPFADASAIPSMLLAKHTRKHVTVALSGDAGDELFLGYHRYDWLRIIGYFMKLPWEFRKTLASAMLASPNYKLKVIGNVINSKSSGDAYLKTVFDSKPKYLKVAVDSEIESLRYLNHTQKDIFQRAGDFDLKTYLPFNINVKVDRAAMAFSLEGRSPLLDYRVVEFAQKLPTSFKYVKGNQKRILKDILYNHVPQELFNRPKSGFTMPFKVWFRDELKGMVLDTLNRKSLEELPNLNSDYVLNEINNHMGSKANNYSLIWKLLVLRQWFNCNSQGKSIV